MQAVYQDPETAPISAQLRTMLSFLAKLSLQPDDVSAADLEPVRDAGVSDAAIEDALMVGALFNVMDRIADALDFEVPEVQGTITEGPGRF